MTLTRILPPFAFVAMSLSACGFGSSYPYVRQDSVYVSGTQYKTEISSSVYFETGWSPDLGSKRVNTTRSTKGGDFVYQIDLPGGAAIWITDAGPQGKEQDYKAGAEFSVHPTAVWVDNATNPTRWHMISRQCADDPAKAECFDEAVVHIVDRKIDNKQKKSPITDDYRQSDDNVIRVYGVMKYYVCDADDWKKNKRLNGLFSTQESFTVTTTERNHNNWYTAAKELLPCDTKNNAKLLSSLGDGVWLATERAPDGEHTYVGTTTYKKVHDFYNSGFEMDNALFFRRVVLPTGKTVDIPPNGAVTLAFDPTTKKVLVFGINEYDYMKFRADQ